jgi:hypothetical protein
MGVRITTVMWVDIPTKERTPRNFQLISKIHSLNPSKMGEVELEVKVN